MLRHYRRSIDQLPIHVIKNQAGDECQEQTLRLADMPHAPHKADAADCERQGETQQRPHF